MNDIQVTTELGIGGILRGGKLKCKLSIAEIIGWIIIWVMLIAITLGIAAFSFPYSYMKTIINSFVIINRKEEGISKLRCDISLGSMIGHIVIWIIISILTLGIGYFLYIYKVATYCIDNTKIIMD